MVDQRRDKRAPASLKVKYKSATVDQFIEQFGPDVSRGGMFIKTKTPLELGTLLKLELQLSDASPVIQGVGRVSWRRMPGADPSLPAGMGLKFERLEDSSRAIVERIVQARRGGASRFDQSEGAELGPSLAPAPPKPAPAPPAAPPRASIAQPARPSAAQTRPAPLPAAPPQPARPTPVQPATAAPSVPRPRTPSTGRISVVGLFAQSPIASQPPEPVPDSAARSSFFPPAPAPSSSAGRAGVGPAGAFGSARASLASVPAPPKTAAEDAAIDRLFDDVQRASVAPKAAPSPPPRSFAEADDVFAALSEEEGLTSNPPRLSRASASAPDSAVDAIAALAQPERTSSPGRASSPGHVSSPGGVSAPSRGAVPSPARASAARIDEDVAAPTSSLPPGFEDDSGELGEADLGGGRTAPPPPTLAAPHTSLPSPALHELAQPAERSALPAVLLGLLVVAGGAGYWYYQRMQAEAAAREAEAAVLAAEEVPAEAVAPAPAPAAAAAAPTPAGAQAQAPGAPAVPTTPAVMLTIELTSLPRGAEVIVDGKYVGSSPLRVELPEGRPSVVIVRSPGFAAEARTLAVEKGQEPLRFKLEPLDYFLYVRSEPPEAELSVGTKTAVAPGPLPLGHLDGGVVVSVAKPGHQRMTRPVRLEEFVEVDKQMRAAIDVRLSPLPGWNPNPTPEPPPASGSSRKKPKRPAASAPPPAPSTTAPAAPPAPSGATAPSPAPPAVPAPTSAPAAPVPAAPAAATPAPAAPAPPAPAPLTVTPSPAGPIPAAPAPAATPAPAP